MAGTFVFYRYTPSLAAAVIFVVIFTLVTCLHLFHLARYRAWFMLPVLVGGVCMFPSHG